MTAPNSEQRAIKNLMRQGYECYHPRCQERRGSRLVTCALFSRYVFILLVDKWHSILGTIGVSQLLMNGDKPAVLRDEIVRDIKAREDEQGLIHLYDKPRFTEGQSVSITDGAFAGSFGIYAGMSADDREIVLLNLLGRRVKVSLPAGSLG